MRVSVRLAKRLCHITAIGSPILSTIAIAEIAGERAIASGTGIADIRITQDFEGGSLGAVERRGETAFRCRVEGQTDQNGRNRQATWYYFRVDNAKGRPLTITLTDLVGEYNNRPGAVSMNAETIPVYSYDNRTWHHFPAMNWDDTAKEATLRLTPEKDRVWIAHIPPYPLSRIEALLRDVARLPGVKVEEVGRSVRGRKLSVVTVTDSATPDAGKAVVWLIARQHAWEAGTSWVAEGALRWITSRAPEARELRKRLILRVVPTMDPDGCAEGKVRFNANGFDLNRHWDRVDPHSEDDRKRMPEIWGVKRRISTDVRSGGRIDLLLNLHNTETAEYMEIPAGVEPLISRAQRLYDRLVAGTTFDPSRPLVVGGGPTDTTSALYKELHVPVVLIEQRISAGAKLGRPPTVEDRLRFGGGLIPLLAASVQ
jgi:hypothetical protein